MAKKCKFCNTRIISEDRHSACVDCRADKKGDDPCVRNKTCKFCETLSKMAADVPKKDRKDKDKSVASEDVLNLDIDDRILDEDDPEPVKKSSDSSPSVADTLAVISAQLATLSQRLDTLEGDKKASASSSSSSAPSSSVTREAPRKQSSTSCQSSKQVASTVSVDESDDLPGGLEDKEPTSEGEVLDEEPADSVAERDPDLNFVEMIQAVKAVLDLPDPDPVTFQPPTAFQKEKVLKGHQKTDVCFPSTTGCQGNVGV